MGYSTDDVEGEKDGAYWDIDANCGYASKGSGGSWIGRMQSLFTHGGNLVGDEPTEDDRQEGLRV